MLVKLLKFTPFDAREKTRPWKSRLGGSLRPLMRRSLSAPTTNISEIFGNYFATEELTGIYNVP